MTVVGCGQPSKTHSNTSSICGTRHEVGTCRNPGGLDADLGAVLDRTACRIAAAHRGRRRHSESIRNHGYGSAWRIAEPGGEKIAHSAYMVEYCDHALQFLFDGIGQTGCHYLRYDTPNEKYPFQGSIQVGGDYGARGETDGPPHRPRARGWQHVLSTGWKRDAKWSQDRSTLALTVGSVAFCPEIWLSRLGVGVLSIPLLFQSSTKEAIELSQVMDFHHALATAQKSVCIGAAGGTEGHLDFHEHIGQMISPLHQLGRVQCESRAMVYTTLELANALSDFGNDEFATDALRILGHLAQVHPGSHCGGRQDVHGMTINAEHGAVVDLAGFAHAIIPSRAANSDRQQVYAVQRGERTQFAYFPAALLAILQRLIITELLRRATQQASSASAPAQQAISEIRRLALAFGLEGEFIQVAQRSTIQKYHELSQKSCEVHQGLETIQSSLDGFAQMELEEQGRHREQEAARAERNSEILECFLASVYSVAVAHYLSEAFHIPHNFFAGITMVALQIATVLTVVLQLRSSHDSSEKKSSWPVGTRLIWLLLGYIAVFIVLNLTLNSGTKDTN